MAEKIGTIERDASRRVALVTGTRVSPGSWPSARYSVRPRSASAMNGLWKAPETVTFIARPPASFTRASRLSHASAVPATTVWRGLL